MKLSKIASLALKGTSREFKESLASILGTSSKSLYRWIDDNKEDGPLTSDAAVDAIADEAGINKSQRSILTEN
jgi:hypothetical protein